MDKNQHYAVSMFKHHGFLTRTDPTTALPQWNTASDSGRADIVLVKNGKGVHVEVKRGTDSFNLGGWRDNQRAWALRSTQPPFSTPYWLYLTLGTDPASYRDDAYRPKRSWLIPLSVLERCIVEISPHQSSIPYRLTKGSRKVMRDNRWDAITLFEHYELEWCGERQLIRPPWVSPPTPKKNAKPKTKPVNENDLKLYGGFWVLPRTHPFFIEYVGDAHPRYVIKKESES